MTTRCYLDFLPLDAPLPEGQPLECDMDRPAAVHVACGCGWIGPALALSEQDLDAWHGDPQTPEEYEAMTRLYEGMHAEGIVPALAEALEHLQRLAGAGPAVPVETPAWA